MSKLFIVTGISGSGKTTIARHLVKKGEVAFDSKLNPGLYQFVDSEGRVAESVHLLDEAWRKQYKWTLNEKRLDELLKQNQNATRIFLCGKANLFQYWNKADGVFLLQVDAPTLLRRLGSELRDNLFAKDKTTQDRLLGDLDSVQNKIMRKGAGVIDAKASIENVVDQILREVELR